ncbi:MAG: hypothetical protein KDC38_06455 [Planctomycetes bacterium]|nr:hypothetical protein [Planctomycetota bacterium]
MSSSNVRALVLAICVLAPTLVVRAQCPGDAVSVWRLNEPVAGSYLDEQGVRNGSCDGACPVPIDGLAGGAQSFGGAGGIAIAADPAYDFGATDDFSIEMWFRTSASGVVGTMFGRVDPTTSLGIFVGTIPGGQVGFSLVSTSGQGVTDFVASGFSVANGEWHHVVAVRDGAAQENRIYVDGTLASVNDTNYTTGFGSESAALGIGVTPGQTSNDPFVGDIDEVVIYASALGEDRVAANHAAGLLGLGVCDPIPPSIISVPPLTAAVGDLYRYSVVATGNPAPQFVLNSAPDGVVLDSETGELTWVPSLLQTGSAALELEAQNAAGSTTQAFVLTVEQDVFECPEGMILYLPLDETQGGHFRDRVGEVDLDCLDECPSPSSGVVGGAQFFAGVESGLVGATGGALDFDAETSFSIECWFRMSSPSTEIFVGRIDLENGLELWLGQHQGGVAFLVKDTSGAPGVFPVTPESFADGQWHHAVGVRRASSAALEVYVDGELRTSMPESFTEGFASPNALLTVGWLASGAGFGFDGDLDEIAVYDRALEAAEITEHHTRGLAGQRVCDPLCPQVQSLTGETTLCGGEPLSLAAEILGTTPLQIQWSKDGVDLPGETSPILSVETVGPAGSGNYSVLATNACGLAMQTVTVTVLAGPSIETEPSDVEACEGDLIELSVIASGPRLAYQWFHDGALVPGATDSVLSLTFLPMKDAGSYTVVVTSPCGQVSSSAATVSIGLDCGGKSEMIRGDVNADGRLNIADVVAAYSVAVMGIGVFLCEDAADFDDDGVVTETDAIALALSYFLGGPLPVSPWPNCGPDPTADDLTCQTRYCP